MQTIVINCDVDLKLFAAGLANIFKRILMFKKEEGTTNQATTAQFWSEELKYRYGMEGLVPSLLKGNLSPDEEIVQMVSLIMKGSYMLFD